MGSSIPTGGASPAKPLYPKLEALPSTGPSSSTDPVSRVAHKSLASAANDPYAPSAPPLDELEANKASVPREAEKPGDHWRNVLRMADASRPVASAPPMLEKARSSRSYLRFPQHRLPDGYTEDSERRVYKGVNEKGEPQYLNGVCRLEYAKGLWFETTWKDGKEAPGVEGQFGFRDYPYTLSFTWDWVKAFTRSFDQARFARTVDSNKSKKININEQVGKEIMEPRGAYVQDTGLLTIKEGGELKDLALQGGRFSGTMVDGRLSEGIWLSREEDGTVYVGRWDEGAPIDVPIDGVDRHLPNALTYSHPIADGQQTVKFYDGSTFTGQWKDGVCIGRGDYTTLPPVGSGKTTPSVRQIDWNSLIQSRQGVSIELDKNILPANFVERDRLVYMKVPGKPEGVPLNGSCEFHYSDGTVFEGMWRNGRCDTEGAKLSVKMHDKHQAVSLYTLKISWPEFKRLKERAGLVDLERATSNVSPEMRIINDQLTSPKFVLIQDDYSVIKTANDLSTTGRSYTYKKGYDGYYAGSVRNGSREKGIMLYPNGTMYCGVWKNNAPLDGSVQDPFVNNINRPWEGFQFTQERNFLFHDGMQFSGTWVNGVCGEGQWRQTGQTEDGFVFAADQKISWKDFIEMRKQINRGFLETEKTSPVEMGAASSSPSSQISSKEIADEIRAILRPAFRRGEEGKSWTKAVVKYLHIRGYTIEPLFDPGHRDMTINDEVDLVLIKPKLPLNIGRADMFLWPRSQYPGYHILSERENYKNYRLQADFFHEARGGAPGEDFAIGDVWVVKRKEDFAGFDYTQKLLQSPGRHSVASVEKALKKTFYKMTRMTNVGDIQKGDVVLYEDVHGNLGVLKIGASHESSTPPPSSQPSSSNAPITPIDSVVDPRIKRRWVIETENTPLRTSEASSSSFGPVAAFKKIFG